MIKIKLEDSQVSVNDNCKTKKSILSFRLIFSRMSGGFKGFAQKNLQLTEHNALRDSSHS